MGYRSTVAYTIRFTAQSNGVDSPTEEELNKCKESFYTFLAEAKVKYLGAVNDECTKVDESNMAINFLADNVKWYESYEDVIVHESFIQLSKDWADMENKHIGGIFMRVGEELDDMVQEGWGEHDWDWMDIARTINVDWEG